VRTVSRFFREDPAFAGLLLASCQAALFVIWLPSYLPLLDHPQHVWLLDAMANFGDPVKRYADYFDLGFECGTYDLYYWPGALLATVLGAEAASRLLLSLYALFLPFGMVVLLDSRGRSRRFALLAVPLVLNTNFVLGFESFCLSLAMLPWILALAERCFAERTRRREIALAAALNALFLMHALTFLVALGVAFLWSLQRGGGARGLLRRLVPVAAGTPLFLVWLVRHFLLQPGGQFAPGMSTVNLPLDQRLSGVPEAILGGFNGQADSWAFLVFAGTVVVCVLLAPRGGVGEPGAPRRPFLVEYRAEMAVLALFLAYLVTPYQIPGIWYVGPRLLVPAALLLVAALRLDVSRRRAAVLVPVALLNVWWPLQAYHAFLDVSRQVGDLDRAVAVVRPGSRFLALVFHGDDGVMRWNPFLHAAAYAAVEKGGAAGFSFAENPAVPVRYRHPDRSPHPNEWSPWFFHVDKHGAFYDYLLVRAKPGVHPNPFGNAWRRVVVDYFGERWSVFHVVRRPQAVLYDFVQRLPDARAWLVRGDEATPCAVTAPGRFQCGTNDWEFVGLHETGPLGGRVTCIWVHPVPGAVLRVTFPDVPLGDGVYGLFGLASTAQVDLGPRLRVTVGDAPPAAFGHEGRNAFSLFWVGVPAGSRGTADVTFEIASPDVTSQHACFLGGTVRQPAPR
jgi:hypothetical protein